MFAIHTAGMMYVRIDFADIVKVTMGDASLVLEFKCLVLQVVQIELGLEVAQATKRQGFGWAVRNDRLNEI